MLFATVCLILLPCFAMAKPQVCMRDECFKAANRLKATMNPDASPCDDFYEYACGGWMKSESIPEDKSEWGTLDVLITKLSDDCISLLKEPEIKDPKTVIERTRAFYQQCVETENASKNDGNQELISFLNDIGGMPLITSTTYNADIDWQARTANIKRNLGLNLLMDVDVNPDVKNPGGFALYIDQPGAFGLGRLEIINKEQKSIDAYAKFLRETLCMLNEEDNCDEDYMKDDIQNAIDFESNLAKLTKDPSGRRDPNALFVKMTVSELQEKVPNLPISWLAYFNTILQSSGINLEESTEIIVSEPEYLKDMIDLVKATDEKILANFFGWRVLQAVGLYSSKYFRENEFHFDAATKGIQKQGTITDSCYTVTNSFYGYAVGSLYVEKHFPKEAKKDMDEMVKNLASAFRKSLADNIWMDETTKAKAEAKLAAMVSLIGYPTWIEDSDALEKRYRHLKTSHQNEHFLPTLLKATAGTIKFKFQKLNEKARSREEWQSQPTEVNAFYDPSSNAIIFPAPILQPPFYQYNTLQVLNYGGIGYAIGHEMSHGYDDQGSQYNEVGKLEAWWSESTRAQFNHKKECFINQYNAQKVYLEELDETIYLNGNATIGENIADNGGIRQAFLAYQMTDEPDIRLPGLEDLDQKKLFFIAAGSVWCSKFNPQAMKEQMQYDSHPIGQFRTTIPLSNTDQFAEAFQCEKGTAMNPEKKCVLW